MGIYKDNAKRDLTTLLNSLQKGIVHEKPMKTISIEERVGIIIDNILREAESNILLRLKNVKNNN